MPARALKCEPQFAQHLRQLVQNGKPWYTSFLITRLLAMAHHNMRNISESQPLRLVNTYEWQQIHGELNDSKLSLLGLAHANEATQPRRWSCLESAHQRSCVVLLIVNSHCL